MDDSDIYWSILVLLAVAASIGVMGSFFGQHLYTPSTTFKAVCRTQGGEPYKHIQAEKNRATSICLKGGTTIPVVTH